MQKIRHLSVLEYFPFFIGVRLRISLDKNIIPAAGSKIPTYTKTLQQTTQIHGYINTENNSNTPDAFTAQEIR